MLLIVESLKTITMSDCDYKTLCWNPHQILNSLSMLFFTIYYTHTFEKSQEYFFNIQDFS